MQILIEMKFIPFILYFFQFLSFLKQLEASSSVCFEQKKIASSLKPVYPLKPCSLCKWFIKKEDTDDSEDGFCEIFKNNLFLKNDFLNRNKHVIECRQNELLCGENACYFEPIGSDMEKENYPSKPGINNYLKELLILREKMIEMEELNCGEVNENNDLENWDKEYKQIKSRIEKIIKLSKE